MASGNPWHLSSRLKLVFCIANSWSVLLNISMMRRSSWEANVCLGSRWRSAFCTSQTFIALFSKCVRYILCFKWMQSTTSHLRSILILCAINFYILQVIRFVRVSTKTLCSDQCDYCLQLCNPISVTGAWSFVFWSVWLLLATL